MKQLTRHYANIASTVALVIALTVGGAYAAGKITSKDIQNGTIRKVDLRKNAVTPKKVKFPKARAVNPAASSAASPRMTRQFERVATLGTYDKLDGSAVLQVTWAAVVHSNASCIFQLRVDGDPPPQGGGEAFYFDGTPGMISTQALFPGLARGEHVVEVYARVTLPVFEDPTSYCTVGHPSAPLAQTVNAAELVQ
jgi:hypothetical protein